VGRRWTLEELDASEPAVSAVGTLMQGRRPEIGEPFTVVSVLGVGPGHGLGGAESVPTVGEKSGTGAVGQKAVVPDPDEALGKNVEQEAATELSEGKRLGPGAARAIVLVAEGDGPVVDVEEPVVGDRDAVGVASEVPQDLSGAVERRLGIDHPLGAAGLMEEAVERRRAPVGKEAAV